MSAPEPANDGRLRTRRGIVLGALVLGVIAAAFHHQWTWGFFDLFSFKPRFADTVALLAAGQAQHAGLDIYAPNPFDPLHRPHVYGPGWLVTGALGLTVKDAVWVGALLVVVFVVVAAAVLAPRRWRDLGVALALLCSPPVLLGVDRANNDLVVFILLAATAWLLVRSRAFVVVGGFVLGLAATLKLYPFAALPILALPVARRNALTWAGAVGAASLAVLWLWRDDYRQALHHAPRPDTIFAYGIAVMTTTWRALVGFRTPLVIGLGAGTLVGGLAFARRVGRLWTCVPTGGFSAMAFLAGAMSWVFCFLATSNFPYRVVLVLLPARLWLEQISAPDDKGTARTQLFLWAAVCWIEVAKVSWAALARPDLTLTSPAWTWLELICGFEQALVAVLTLALAVSVLGAFARWWRAGPLRAEPLEAPRTASGEPTR